MAKGRKIYRTRPRTQRDDLPGYPVYPPIEDIYNTGVIEVDLDPENISATKVGNEKFNKSNETYLGGEIDSGIDLDIPGSELDDEQEYLGSEDEENNYYSLGGDDHENLEEDFGDART